ncbi:MAG TPA: AAA family ATPase [bacterium]|nr:AAA family ATPase [bacterium]
MLNELFSLSRTNIAAYRRPYQRYFLKVQPLDHRLSILVGQRGVGKSTALVQRLLSVAGNDETSERILYIPADHFTVREYSLYEIAEEFLKAGGTHICFDEIHKYPDWSMELKSIYDTFPALTVYASGSNALQIHKGSHDLSRRALVYTMRGMSLREYIEMELGIELPAHALSDILSRHEKLAGAVCAAIAEKGRKILPLFDRYLRRGHYPYFRDFKNDDSFHLAVEQNIRAVIEGDLPAIYPSLSGESVKRMKLLLGFIAREVPFIPDLSRLRSVLAVGDDRTLKNYLQYLADAGLIMILPRGGAGMGRLEKLGKIYLDNTTQMAAIGGGAGQSRGTMRETFFANMLLSAHRVAVPARGDFVVDDTLYFEVGGKNKGFDQIKEHDSAYLAVDGIEAGTKGRVPLWMFGFLY